MYIGCDNVMENILDLHKLINAFEPAIKFAEEEFRHAEKLSSDSYDAYDSFMRTDDMSEDFFKLKSKSLCIDYDVKSKQASLKRLVLESLIDGLKKQLKNL